MPRICGAIIINHQYTVTCCVWYYTGSVQPQHPFYEFGPIYSCILLPEFRQSVINHTLYTQDLSFDPNHHSLL
jgi:hypothetical protein